jgi:hypothetical protein
MSEPKSKAKRITEVAPGIYHWSLQDDRIDFRSEAYAIVEKSGTILIDPLPLEDEALERLGSIRAICLTGSCHQRSAWRYRRRFGAAVHAPANAEGLEEEQDISYRADYRLPGGLVPLHAPGPTEVHYAFLRDLGSGTLFCADVLVHEGGGRLRFVEDRYQDEPERTRETARAFLDLRFETLCPAHGEPLTHGTREAVRHALR